MSTSSNTFYIKQGDSSPKLIYTLSPAVNLSGATVVFNMTPQVGTDGTITRASADVEDVEGVVGFAFTVEHTETPGWFNAEFEITYADTTVETFPNKGYIPVFIDRDLG